MSNYNYHSIFCSERNVNLLLRKEVRCRATTWTQRRPLKEMNASATGAGCVHLLENLESGLFYKPKAYFIGKQARKHPTELETRTPATIISGKQGADLSTLT